MRFSITQMFVGLTLLALAIAVIRNLLPAPLYGGVLNDSGYEEFVFEMNNLDLESANKFYRNYPIWHSSQANPPLSARAALTIADDYRKKNLRETGMWCWGVDSIQLSPIDGKTGKWCWCVQFSANVKNGYMSGNKPQVTAYVLMNGMVASDKSLILSPELQKELLISPPSVVEN